MKPHAALLYALAAGLFWLAVGACSPADAQEPTVPEVPALPEIPSALEAIPWPSQSEPAAEDGDVSRSNRLEAEYQFDSRSDTRVVSFEGSSRIAEHFQLYGMLDLQSSLDQDLARFSLRTGLFTSKYLAFWYEDFSGSWNEVVRVGAYYDVSTEPWVRLMGLPVATEGGGIMARAMFEVPIRERWSCAGFFEHAWGDDGGDFTACEPELRYEIQGGIWATLEYRRDERMDDFEGLALGLRAAL